MNKQDKEILTRLTDLIDRVANAIPDDTDGYSYWLGDFTRSVGKEVDEIKRLIETEYER